MNSSTPGALHGVKVLDLTTMILGPVTGQYLGDMGADIIKVEPPEGDLTRYIGPERSHGMGSFYLNSNRNKRSVVLDIKKPAGHAVLNRMIEQSDVVLHSIRNASAEKLGLSYPALAERNPKIILCHVKGYSDHGAYAGLPAYDDVVQASSGLAMMQAVIAGEPRYVPSILADKVAAVHAAYAVVVALFHRERTGQGQQVDVPMMETMVAFNTIEHLWGAAFVPSLAPMGYLPVSTAARRPFKTQDGYLCVLPYTDAHWKRFCEVVGDPALTGDPRFSSHAARQRDQQGFWDEVGRQVQKRSTQHWIDALTVADVPFGRVNSFDDLLADPHLVSIGFWQTMEHPTEGPLRVSQPPMGFSASPAGVRRLAPRLGQDTDEVLREFGVSDGEIEQLRATGVTQPRLKARAAPTPDVP